MKSTHKLIIVAVLSLIPLSGCSLTKRKGIAEAAVSRFHDQYNNGRFHEIYLLRLIGGSGGNRLISFRMRFSF
jgi:hypothetical protein